jgi:hypothetical protein
MPLRVLSLGAGVQSTTLALMAAHGEIPQPDFAVFADTGWEPAEVYRHLDRLEAALPFPVYRVRSDKGDIRDSIATGDYEPIPWHIPGTGGNFASMGRRQCTKVYKLYPIRRFVRAALGGKTPRGGCDMLIGISTNEAHRMKASSVDYIVNRFPLIDLGMNRHDCRARLAGWGVDCPRSACCGCPFLNDEDWGERRKQPEWGATVALSYRLAERGQFMHRSLRTMDKVDLAADAERGQPDLFGAECEGMCGV